MIAAMTPRGTVDRARLVKRRNRFRALYWTLSLGPPLVVISIGLNVGGSRQPVVDELTHLLTHSATASTH